MDTGARFSGCEVLQFELSRPLQRDYSALARVSSLPTLRMSIAPQVQDTIDGSRPMMRRVVATRAS